MTQSAMEVNRLDVALAGCDSAYGILPLSAAIRRHILRTTHKDGNAI